MGIAGITLPALHFLGTNGYTGGMTVREIAELAGVSIGTVDRVLHKRGRVSAATREKIEAIVEEYQFTPNPIASRLKRGRSYRFCALLPRRDQDAGYWEQIIEGIARGAGGLAPLGVDTEIVEYDRYNAGEAREKMALVLAENPEGLIVAPIVLIKPLLPLAAERRIPYLFLDSAFPEMEPVCTICQDPLRGGGLAGRLMHLFAGKVRKPVAVLDIHSRDYHIIRRREGFLRYAREQGFPLAVKEYLEESELSGEAIELFLSENPELTGVFVTNCMSHRFARYLKESGRKKDFFIIGYDLINANKQFLKEGLIDAIISQRPEEQGRLAVVNLYRRLVLEEKIEKTVEIPLDIYIKENIPDL
jgi:LacI family transcriptional regulator